MRQTVRCRCRDRITSLQPLKAFLARTSDRTLISLDSLSYVIEDLVTAVLDLVQNMLKILFIAIVRIRDILALLRAEKLREVMKLVSVFWWAPHLQCLHIAVIHGENQIKSFKIIR